MGSQGVFLPRTRFSNDRRFCFCPDGNRLFMEIGRPERQYEIEPLEDPVPREEPDERPSREREPALPALEPLTT
jgi:hypothetical protein